MCTPVGIRDAVAGVAARAATDAARAGGSTRVMGRRRRAVRAAGCARRSSGFTATSTGAGASATAITMSPCSGDRAREPGEVDGSRLRRSVGTRARGRASSRRARRSRPARPSGTRPSTSRPGTGRHPARAPTTSGTSVTVPAGTEISKEVAAPFATVGSTLTSTVASASPGLPTRAIASRSSWSARPRALLTPSSSKMRTAGTIESVAGGATAPTTSRPPGSSTRMTEVCSAATT